MTKNIDTTQERADQAFRNRCNEAAKERAAKNAAALNDAVAKATERAKEALEKAFVAAEKNRKKKLGRELAKCFLATACIVGLCLAEIFGLISDVLTNPAITLALIYFGWHACKVNTLLGRK